MDRLPLTKSEGLFYHDFNTDLFLDDSDKFLKTARNIIIKEPECPNGRIYNKSNLFKLELRIYALCMWLRLAQKKATINPYSNSNTSRKLEDLTLAIETQKQLIENLQKEHRSMKYRHKKRDDEAEITEKSNQAPLDLYSLEVEYRIESTRIKHRLSLFNEYDSRLKYIPISLAVSSLLNISKKITSYGPTMQKTTMVISCLRSNSNGQTNIKSIYHTITAKTTIFDGFVF